MPDKSTNTTPRPSASNGRGTLGSTPLAASLEPTSSPDTRPTSAVGQPGAAMAGGAREECTRETRSRRRLFAGAALGAISLAGLTLSLLLLVAPGILPGTGGAFPEGEASSTQSLFAGGFGGEDGADRDGAGTEGAFGDAASVNDETGATSDGAGTADASTAAPSANGAAPRATGAAIRAPLQGAPTPPMDPPPEAVQEPETTATPEVRPTRLQPPHLPPLRVRWAHQTQAPPLPRPLSPCPSSSTAPLPRAWAFPPLWLPPR